MTQRSGFYTDGTNVIQRVCTIEWDLGFDKEAKRTYIERIKEALPSMLNPMIDITSASPNAFHRSLSPIFIEYGGSSIEDFIKLNPQVMVPGVIDFFYISSLSPAQMKLIKETNCFIDVFHKPSNGRSTQAAWCVYAKLLMLKNKEHLLTNLEEFLAWYNDVGFFTVGG